MKKTTEEKSVPEEIQYILDKAQALNERQEAWEHHLLFPKCIFNKNNGKWANIFEDQEEIVESITFYEPISNLKKIERLYYAQKR